MNKFAFLTVFILFSGAVNAAEIDKNTAKMQAMDKITGRVSVVNVAINTAVDFGSLSILVRSCKTRPADEIPDNFAFVDITDKNFQGEEFNIFKGWMISSSPATHAVEHPIYDVWLLQCVDEKIDETKILSDKQLAERDKLPMKKEGKSVAKNKLKNVFSERDEPIKEITADEKQKNVLQPEDSGEFLYDEEDVEEVDEAAPELSEDNPETSSD